MKNSIVVIFVLLFIGVHPLIGQHDYQGCHHNHSKIKHKKWTPAQNKLIQDSNARSDTFDIFHYDITIDVTDYSDKFITAETAIDFSPLMESLDQIIFDLRDLTVDSVVYNNELLTFSQDTANVFIQFEEVLEVADTISVTIFYQGNPYQDPEWGGFYFEGNYIYNLGIGLTTIPPNFGKVWYPCFDSFVERATYTYHVKSADARKAYCQGNFISEETLEGDTVVRHFDFNQPIPTFLSAIAVAEYETIEYDHPGNFGNIPITLIGRPNNIGAMEGRLEALGDAIDALEYWYGPYIWGRVGYVLTTDGALEIPTNIAYPASMMGSSLFNNGQLFTHELGHQWWGNVVTPLLHNHMWIKEGPAEYSGHLFVEWTDGQEEFEEVVKDNHLFVLEDAHLDDEGYWPLSPIPDEHIYGRHTYYKGASVMHNLRGYLGDDLFRETMTQVQEQYMFTAVDANGFKDAMEQVSGYDLDPFFNDWIFSPGFSTFVVDSFASVLDGEMYNTTVYLKQKLRAAPNFHTEVPIELAAVNSDWSETVFSAVVSEEYDQVEIQTDFLPEFILFNPNNRLNGARMDEDAKLYPDENYNHQLDYGNMRVKKNSVTDSSLVHVTHVWSAPEQDLGEYIDEISTTHYWIVNGIWSADADIEGRIYYDGNNEGDIDEELSGESEENMLPVYRPDTDSPWEEYTDYEASQGSLNNGTGHFKLFHLKKGQYAFAKGTTSVSIAQKKTSEIEIYPNPTPDKLMISNNGKPISRIEIYDLLGEKVLESKIATNQISLKKLTDGNYLVLLFGEKDEVVYRGNVKVVK